MIGLALGFAGFATSVIGSGMLLTYRLSRHESYAVFAVANGLCWVGNAVDGNILGEILSGAPAVVFAWLWWRNRPRGKGRKALRELGAKSKARVEALVERLTRSPIPSPAGAV